MERITCHVPLRWGDMDAYGHINNVQVVRVLEEARIQAFGPPGGTGLPGIEPQVPLFSDVPFGFQILVVEHRVRYVAPLEYRNVPVVVTVWISKIGAASMDVDYLLHDGVSGVECVRATTELAFVAGGTGQLQRTSAGQRIMAEPFLGKSVFRLAPAVTKL